MVLRIAELDGRRPTPEEIKDMATAQGSPTVGEFVDLFLRMPRDDRGAALKLMEILRDMP